MKKTEIGVKNIIKDFFRIKFLCRGRENKIVSSFMSEKLSENNSEIAITFSFLLRTRFSHNISRRKRKQNKNFPHTRNIINLLFFPLQMSPVSPLR